MVNGMVLRARGDVPPPRVMTTLVAAAALASLYFLTRENDMSRNWKPVPQICCASIGISFNMLNGCG